MSADARREETLRPGGRRHGPRRSLRTRGADQSIGRNAATVLVGGALQVPSRTVSPSRKRSPGRDRRAGRRHADPRPRLPRRNSPSPRPRRDQPDRMHGRRGDGRLTSSWTMRPWPAIARCGSSTAVTGACASRCGQPREPPHVSPRPGNPNEGQRRGPSCGWASRLLPFAPREEVARHAPRLACLGKMITIACSRP
jgi:hypothetical protein